MNEFIEQFLIESREQVEQATADLLALEKSPGDRERLDSAFRSFHTLKGGAGIVDFDAMAHAVHAAEDVLSEIRAGTRAITTALISDCFTCLDQVVQWLDAMQNTGDLPAQAQVEAEAVVARFARSTAPPSREVPQREIVPARWLEALLDANPALRGKARTAVRYRPEADCFFDGVDPLARLAALPGLLVIDAAPVDAWPPLESLDPYHCNLVLLALSGSSPGEVSAALGDQLERTEILAIAAAPVTSTVGTISSQGRALLEAQILLLGEAGAEGTAGRMASAGAVAINVLQRAGRSANAGVVRRALDVGLIEGKSGGLRDAIDALLHEQPAMAATPSGPAADQESATRTLRVDAARIDALVNLTGELTVAKNAIGYATKLAQEGEPVLATMLKQRYAVLDRLIGELQQSVLGMRVLPLRQVFQRFPRLLREIAGDLGKPANLVIDGAETEADKAIVEMLFEPLLHVLRNAIDHGVEDPATRAASGKPPMATIRLRAERLGESVVVALSDDGKGIDVARVRQVAQERKVVAEDQLAAMSDEEAIDLIFEPGFSTTGTVTDLSGRGVGMDVVRTAVSRMGGQVAVESRAGEGTTVRFTLPFSVMMTRVMMVSAAGQSFGIPLDAVVETLRIKADRISPVGAAQAVVIRHQTVPLVALSQALGLSAGDNQDDEAILVVTKIDGFYNALRVDQIGERMEVMLKPLDGLLAGMRGLAGSTLLGDGSVLLILDLGELFQ